MKLAEIHILDVQWKFNSCEIIGLYIVKELATSISSDEIIKAYDPVASRRANFKLIDM
jgi:hypothetical protein